MKLVDEIESPQPRGLRVKTHRTAASQHSLFLILGGRRRRQRPFGPLTLDEAVPHPLLHAVHRGASRVLLGLLILTYMHRFSGGAAVVSGGEGILGRSGGGVGRRMRRGSSGEERREGVVGVVEDRVDLSEEGRVRGGRELPGH